MSTPKTDSSPLAAAMALHVSGNREQLHREFQHLRAGWCWLFCFGILLVLCGTAAIVVPAATLGASAVAMIVLGVSLMVAGISTIIAAFWAGRWSGLLVQLLVGILYVMAGYEISDTPLQSATMMAAFVAALFIVLGAFRSIAALVIRFPHWGWALLNGALTFLCGVVIYRHFPEAAPWVIGLLIGLEMLAHGFNWIMLSLAIRRIPQDA